MRGYTIVVLLLAGSVPAISEELEECFGKLKEAAVSKDAALVKRLAVETYALARKQAAVPAPDTDVEKETWTNRVGYLHDVETYTEYLLYTTALAAPAAVTVDLLATLEQQNADSKYLDQAYVSYFSGAEPDGGRRQHSRDRREGTPTLPRQ